MSYRTADIFIIFLSFHSSHLAHVKLKISSKHLGGSGKNVVSCVSFCIQKLIKDFNVKMLKINS